MSDFFGKISNGVESVQAQFLGPTYNYAKQIRNPDQLNMSSDGNMGALARDINGIIQYVDVLVTGKGQASKPGKPLGNKFYLKVGGQCTDPNGNLQDRYLFVNNIPTGSIPGISAMTGSNLKDFRGLVPGTIENVGKLNPLAIFGGMMQGANPTCMPLGLKDDKGRSGLHVATADVANLDACLFPGGRNPVPNNCPCNSPFCPPEKPSDELKKACGPESLGGNPQKCKAEKAKRQNTRSKKSCSYTKKTGCASGFENMNEKINGLPVYELKLEKNPLANLYNLGFGALLIYILFHFLRKTN